MMQQLLFEPVEQNPPVQVFENFLSKADADDLFKLCQSLPWQQNEIRMLGKWLKLPRQEVLFADSPSMIYKYSSSVTLKPNVWNYELGDLRDKIAHRTGHQYQSCIGNYYRTGADYIGWHSDSFEGMGVRPAIASLSLGAERRFTLRRKGKNQPIHEYWLPHGSLLIMEPGCQEEWLHRLPVALRCNSPRINLTFRPFMTT